MALKDIIGHERPLEILKGCMAGERIPHALLFAGEEGIGKRLVALNFAKALNCLENRESLTGRVPGAPLADIDCCDACSSCVKAEKLLHPDITVITPEGEGRQIVVSSVRRLQETLAYRPFEGLWKIAVIDDADKLNQSAANAFLETLEEPPADSILILISARADMLLPTIRSRCHRIHFSPLPQNALAGLLRTMNEGLDFSQSDLLSTLSGGRVGYAMREELLVQRERSLREFRALLGNPDKDIWADRDSMEKWFDWTQLWIRDIAVFKATGERELLINGDNAAAIEEMSHGADIDAILRLARELNGIRQALKFSLNRQLTLNYTNLLLRKMLGRISNNTQD
jgi:DNA polymerase-3 subunit delta'